MPRFPLEVYARDTALNRIAAIDDCTAVTAVPRYNAVGAYTLELSASSSKAAHLVEGNGLIIRSLGQTVLSGPLRTVDWTRSTSDGGLGKLTVGGVSDETILAEATCWPNPTAAIGSQTSSVYKISGVAAETAMRQLVNINIGPGAAAARRIAGLALAPDLGRGPLVTREINQFDNLLSALQDIASGLGFRVAFSGGGVEFQVYEPQDRSQTARFSFGWGNLQDASYTTTPPTCTKAIVVAGGGSSPRVCKTYPQTDPLFPALVVEQFVDLTGVDTASVDLTAQMDQAAAEALTTGAGQGSLAISPIDLPKLRYARDYNVGDTVAAQLRGGTWWTDVVREVTLTAAPDGISTKATVGSADTGGGDVIARIYRYIAGIKRDVNRVKTRKAG
ncbi:siphovirus ReqiPepy6 Gp37-like family protein [Streptomyces sp. H27-D2]|uniref:siphovirus ReqiPepy6 Gp37-like family protein n=1 Tax=Streptomyces sp. H27-D2 TaxID=3046304 RepID=UPI002DBC929C|nr:siphovirus ReqiPepy6 Gp37-like family protein [Streptomyces sp. H27-D2]MEC4016104.1 siphovirus ReqiPepy6 Gp37-like family protein [Streptomyces sp. H27-D2]